MQVHGSCAAIEGMGVLLTGAPGSGKSDLLLRLVDAGMALVADDRVELDEGWVSAPAALAGMMEVRGLGIVRLPHVFRARLALVVRLGFGARLPDACVHGVPAVDMEPGASAPARIKLALACAAGRVTMVAGVFA